MKYLKINAEYQCSPIWVSEDGEIYNNLNIEESPFDSNLKKVLLEWSNLFDKTLNQNYPPDSGFNSVNEEVEFEKHGLEIWKLIFDGYNDIYSFVQYRSYLLSNIYSDIESYKVELRSKFGLT